MGCACSSSAADEEAMAAPGPEGADAGPAIDSFPNLGVSVRLLRLVVADPRLARPMRALPFVSSTGVWAPVGKVAPPLSESEFRALDIEGLRALAKEYRVDSHLEGEEEFAGYNGESDVSREEWIRRLEQPPTTTAHVNEVIVKVDTCGTGQSYAEMMQRAGAVTSKQRRGVEATDKVAPGGGRGSSRSGGDGSTCNDDDDDLSGDVGHPTVFLSHAWRFRFADVVAAVETHVAGLGDAERDAVRLWNDIFVENQNGVGSKPPDYWYSAFKEAVGAIGHTLVVLSPWDAPVPLTRSWCVWELYSTIATGATLTVAHPPSQRERFEHALVNDFPAVLASVSAIDAKRAQAFSPHDKQRIDATIQSELGGFGAVNELIAAQMRSWLAATGVAALEALRSREGDEAADASTLNSNLAVMIEETGGDGGFAERAKRAALAAITARLDRLLAKSDRTPEDEALRQRLMLDQATRLSNLGGGLESKPGGKGLEEALELHNRAVAVTAALVQEQVRDLGSVSAEILAEHATMVGNLSVCLYRLGRLREAERGLRQAIVYAGKVGDDSGLLDLRHRSNLASVLFKLPSVADCPGRHGLAEVVVAPDAGLSCDACGEDVAAGERAHGCRACDFDVCAKCHAAGDGPRLEEAENLMRGALESRERALGEDHPDTSATRNNFSYVLADRARRLRADRLAFEARGKAAPPADGARWAPDERKALEEALAIAHRVVLNHRKSHGAHYNRTVETACWRVQLLGMLGRDGEARDAAASDVLPGDPASVPVDAVQVAFGVACRLIEADDDDKNDPACAALIFERTLAVLRVLHGVDAPSTVASARNLLTSLDRLPETPESPKRAELERKVREEFGL